VSLFSKRHKRALASAELRVELADPVRVRIWRLMQRYEDSYRDDSNDWTSHLHELQRDLLDAYGASRLSVERGPGRDEVLQFEPWFRASPGHCALDAIEGFARHIEGEWDSFRSGVNDILSEEESSRRLLDEEFVLLDSVFVHEQVVARTQSTLHSVGFSGAAQEMLNAPGRWNLRRAVSCRPDAFAA
jgi:hypothetical protein